MSKTFTQPSRYKVKVLKQVDVSQSLFLGLQRRAFLLCSSMIERTLTFLVLVRLLSPSWWLILTSSKPHCPTFKYTGVLDKWNWKRGTNVESAVASHWISALPHLDFILSISHPSVFSYLLLCILICWAFVGKQCWLAGSPVPLAWSAHGSSPQLCLWWSGLETGCLK